MSTKNKKAVIETSVEVVNEVPVVLEAIEQQIVENQEVMAVAEVKMTKAELARRIFNEELGKGQLVRKTVIERLMDEADLTKAGANTYFQNLRAKAGLVQHRTV